MILKSWSCIVRHSSVRGATGSVKTMTAREISELRSLVKNTLERNLFQSAAFLAERLAVMTEAIADSTLHANCYYRGSQFRRCLAILEQRGFLSAASVADTGKWLNGSVVDTSAAADFEGKIEAIALAAQCLFALEQFEDCVSLLQPLILLNDTDGIAAEDYVDRIKALFNPSQAGQQGFNVNPMSALYCVLGKCYDMLEHRSRSLRALTLALHVDVTCVEAAQYIADSSLLSKPAKLGLYKDLLGRKPASWLADFYRVLLLGHGLGPAVGANQEEGAGPLLPRGEGCSAVWLARQAEFYFEHQDIGEAYRQSRQAYTVDPYDERALYIYVATMVELKLKTELFYLGHELVNSFPKKAMSWYTVGCYYWCCEKFDLAQKHLLKATKLDKRCAKAWVLLGHVMSALEESEQAIAAFRTASRLLPGEHMPLVCTAKELARSNHLAPALHILSSALDICPDDPGLLNELGVTYLKQGSMDLALQFFGKAVHAVDANLNRTRTKVVGSTSNEQSFPAPSIAFTFKATCGSEIFSNYATALRKCERFEEALYWYDKCMATNPSDANCHAGVGFTFHLMQRFDLAVSSYHQALAIQPNLTFCSDMLSRAMEDMSYFPSVLSADPAADADLFENFRRLSRYGVGADPLESGELDRLADANRSLNASLGYAMAEDDSVVVPAARYAEESYASMQLSEMLSPGMSVAQSFSRIEGRLSLTPHRATPGHFDHLDTSSCMSPADNGGYLDDSFE